MSSSLVTDQREMPSLPIRIYNTASRSVEEFRPRDPLGKTVTMYNCGPTVYAPAHIGNLRAYVFADILRRTLKANGYTVRQIVNITDVGHLTSDADEGEDKMAVAMRREHKSAADIAAHYEDAFKKDCAALNIERAEAYPRASGHIAEQIALVKTLEEKGYTYRTQDGIYFDTTKFHDYGKMARLDLEGLREGARVEANKEKRNPTDFALWKFSPEGGAKREQEWESPWGVGFPGWHIECSAMSMKYLCETIDIHTGGIDHIPVHHTNEIAQSEAATGKPFVRYWMHSAHMLVDGQKMSKSLGNTYTLADLEKRGIDPLAYRYWLLTAHYRTQVNFTWEALEGAQTAFCRLREFVAELPSGGMVVETYRDRFSAAICDNLDTPQALATLWELIQDKNIAGADKHATIQKMNDIFAFPIDATITARTLTLHLHLPTHNGNVIVKTANGEPPAEAIELVSEREIARQTKNWAKSDELREKLKSLGWEVKDTPDGPMLSPFIYK